ncbi:hypothetical protein C8R45DRAFT_934017 [Mycena sanguinolenta]|nr:hypothetical protein C8R45DRAFT_934017 [Mycena sanguinolenta]
MWSIGHGCIIISKGKCSVNHHCVKTPEGVHQRSSRTHQQVCGHESEVRRTHPRTETENPEIRDRDERRWTELDGVVHEHNTPSGSKKSCDKGTSLAWNRIKDATSMGGSRKCPDCTPNGDIRHSIIRRRCEGSLRSTSKKGFRGDRTLQANHSSTTHPGTRTSTRDLPRRYQTRTSTRNERLTLDSNICNTPRPTLQTTTHAGAAPGLAEMRWSTKSTKRCDPAKGPRTSHHQDTLHSKHGQIQSENAISRCMGGSSLDGEAFEGKIRGSRGSRERNAEPP